MPGTSMTATATKTIWRVSVQYGRTLPVVDQYRGFEIRETGASVLVNGAKTFLRVSSDVRFFDRRDEMMVCCYAHIERELKKARERVEKLSAKLESDKPWSLFCLNRHEPFDSTEASRIKFD